MSSIDKQSWNVDCLPTCVVSTVSSAYSRLGETCNEITDFVMEKFAAYRHRPIPVEDRLPANPELRALAKHIHDNESLDQIPLQTLAKLRDFYTQILTPLSEQESRDFPNGRMDCAWRATDELRSRVTILQSAINRKCQPNS